MLICMEPPEIEGNAAIVVQTLAVTGLAIVLIDAGASLDIGIRCASRRNAGHRRGNQRDKRGSPHVDGAPCEGTTPLTAASPDDDHSSNDLKVQSEPPGGVCSRFGSGTLST
jgi:hypothetical protein